MSKEKQPEKPAVFGPRVPPTEAMLWASPRRVSQQVLSQRMTSLPSQLFLNILLSILPLLQKRWAERKRPLPPEIAWAQERYCEVQVVDGQRWMRSFAKSDCLKTCAEPACRAAASRPASAAEGLWTCNRSMFAVSIYITQERKQIQFHTPHIQHILIIQGDAFHTGIIKTIRQLKR